MASESIDLLIQNTSNLLSLINNIDYPLEEISEQFEKLERASENLEETDSNFHIVESILSGFNAENFSLYTGAFFLDTINKSTIFPYSGDNQIHEAIQNIIDDIISNDNKSKRFISVDNTVLNIFSSNTVINKYSVTIITVSNSPFFNIDAFENFAYSALQFFTSLHIKSFDIFSDNIGLQNWMLHYTGELHLFYYKFSNFFHIFHHLGIDVVEEINEYILNRINQKYDQNILIYQHTMEKILVFFAESTEDRRTLFNHNKIPIPYLMKKLNLVGKNRYEKLIEFITNN